MSVYLLHGDKGGVGKSMFGAAFAEYVHAKGEKLALIDTDMRNPDLARVFGKNAKGLSLHKVDLRERDGWMELASILDESEATDVVISLPANIGQEVDKEAEDFVEGLKGLNRSLVVFWLMNRSPDSINLFRLVTETFGEHAKAMVAVRNLFFGEPERFRRWGESKTREAFLAKGGIEFDFEDLHERVVDATFLNHPARRFTDAADLRYGERLALNRWVERTFAGFDAIADRIGVGQR